MKGTLPIEDEDDIDHKTTTKTVNKKNPKGKDKKKNDLFMEFYTSRYNYMELDLDKHIEKLYHGLEDDLEVAPKFKYIPSSHVIKSMILKYVQSTLFWYLD